MEAARRTARLAGRLRRHVGAAAGARYAEFAEGTRAEGRHYEHASRVPAQERRSVQRTGDAHGVLRCVSRARRRHDDRDDHRRRSGLPVQPADCGLAFQEGAEWGEVGSHALLGEVVTANLAGEMTLKTTIRATLIAALLLATAAPARAQVDISGTWAQRPYTDSLGYNPGNGPTPVDYTGMPLNEAGLARALALSYDTQISSDDRRCVLYTIAYLLQGPQGVRIWAENDPRTGELVSWNFGFGGVLSPLTVWMDGRPHPSKYAPHTSSGFTTGKWENDILTTYT